MPLSVFVRSLVDLSLPLIPLAFLAREGWIGVSVRVGTSYGERDKGVQERDRSKRDRRIERSAAAERGKGRSRGPEGEAATRTSKRQ